MNIFTETIFSRLFILPIKIVNLAFCCISRVIMSIGSLTEIVKCVNWEISAELRAMTLHDFLFCKLCMIYENYYHEQLAKISTCMRYSIDVYHRYILPSRELKLPSLSWWFPPCYVSPVSWLFPTVSPGAPLAFLLFRCSVSPVSYFRFCK